jgi:hypothetical protein
LPAVLDGCHGVIVRCRGHVASAVHVACLQAPKKQRLLTDYAQPPAAVGHRCTRK